MQNIARTLKGGGIILYPTEGVWGIGCDPFNETAVQRLLKLKGRSISKGLILITAEWSMVHKLIALNLKDYPIIEEVTEPTTWVFPATSLVPPWISGDFDSIAIRATTHESAREICQQFGGVIVSTSANLSSSPSVMRLEDVDQSILDGVDYVVPGEVGKLAGPSKICDVLTMKSIARKNLQKEQNMANMESYS